MHQRQRFHKSPHEVEVDGRVLSTRSIVIAAGARPFVPPIKGLEQVEYKLPIRFGKSANNPSV